MNGIAAQLINAASPAGQADLGKLNFKLAVIKESEPRDQFETMLVAQMAEVHVVTMRLAEQLAYYGVPHSDTPARLLRSAGAFENCSSRRGN